MKKMTKILAMLALGAVAVSSVAFAACGDDNKTPSTEHTHNYTEWKYNDTQHWKVCKEDGAEGPKSNHNLVDGKCECGYTEDTSSALLTPEGDTDWYEYTGEDYAEEDWASKEIAYQFTGVMQLEGGDDSGAGINYPTVMNLYTDGSVRIQHATVMLDGTYSAVSDIYYGLWENTDDSLSISINFVYASDYDQTKKYFERNLYVSGLTFKNGKIQTSLDLDVYAAMAYTRAHELTCDGTIKYADDDAFINSILLAPSDKTDWYEYEGEDYANEDWTSKTIAYQFTGVGKVGAGADSGDGINYPTVMNLYTDGSVRIVHATVMKGMTTAAATDIYYGLWENNDGNLSVSVNFVYSMDTDGTHKYWDRSLYVENLEFEDGKIVISLDLDVYVPMAYTQAHELTCDGTVKFATDEDFTASFADIKQSTLSPYKLSK